MHLQVAVLLDRSDTDRRLALSWQPKNRTLPVAVWSLICIVSPILIVALYWVPNLFPAGAVTGFNLTVLYTLLGVSIGVLAAARALPAWLDRLAPLSVSSLGVYAIHPLVIDAVVRSSGPYGPDGSLPVYVFVPGVLVITWLLSALGSRIPRVGTWLF